MKSNGAVKVSQLVAAGSSASHSDANAPLAAGRAGRPPESHIEFQDLLHSMGRYKWQGLLMAAIIMAAGYFYWASHNKLTYEARASIMRRETTSGVWYSAFLRTPSTGRNRTFDGDLTFMKSEALAEVAQKIGQRLTNLDSATIARLQAAGTPGGVRLRGSDPATISAGAQGDKLLEFRRFGMVAHIPPGTWTLRRLSLQHDLPSEFLDGVELQATDDKGAPTTGAKMKIYVGWNPTPGRELTAADADAARITVQQRIASAANFTASSAGALRENVTAQLEDLGVDPAAISALVEAVGTSDADPSGLVFRYETPGAVVFSAQALTRDCNFIITTTVPKTAGIDIAAQYRQFLQFLVQLRFFAIDGLGPAFNDNADLIDALLRDSALAMEKNELAWIAVNYGTGELADPKAVLDPQSDVLIVPNDLARVLVNAFYGTAEESAPVAAPATDANAADMVTAENAPAAAASNEPAPPSAPTLSAGPTDADRVAILQVLNEATTSFIQRIDVTGERNSGRIEVRVTHPNRNVAVFLANLIPVAFVSANARLSTQRLRADVALHEQQLERARADLRNAQNYLTKLRRDADQEILKAMIYGLYPAVDMTEGNLRRSLGGMTAELTEREVRIRALQGEVRALAYRLALLQFPSDAELAAKIEGEDPIWLPSRDPIVTDIDRRINDLQMQVDKLAIDANVGENGTPNPLFVRRQKELEALLKFREDIAQARREQFERELADIKARRQGMEVPAVDLATLIAERDAALNAAKVTVQTWADGLDAVVQSVFDKGETTMAGAWGRDERLVTDEAAHRLPAAPEFTLDAQNSLAALSEQDLRRRLADLEAALSGWKTVVMKRVDVDAQLKVLPRVFSPVESFGFEVEAKETRVRQIAANLQEARFNATRMADDYEWQQSADPRTLTTRDSSIWLVVIGVVAVLGGIYFTRLWDIMDSRVKTDMQVKEITRLPVLGHIPTLPPSEKYLTPNATGRRSGHLASNLFGILGVNLRHARQQRTERSIAVTSSVPKEGKSLVAYNLASYYAMEGFNTCLLIADIRNPATEIFPDLDWSQVYGFVDHLQDARQHPLDRCIYPTDFENLSVCFPGQADVHPMRVFDEQKFPQLLSVLESRFDAVVIDAPPVIPVADSALIAKFARAVVVVTALGRVTKRDLSESLDRLRFVGAPIAGVVINRDATARQRAYYYYYAPRGAAIGAQSVGEKKALPAPAAAPAPVAGNGHNQEMPGTWAGDRGPFGDDVPTYTDDDENPNTPPY